MTQPLTRQDLWTLAQEATALSDWTCVRDFANQIYGEGRAVKVEIETYGEYNDEGGTDYRIESITAYDKDGDELQADLSLPFFHISQWGKGGYNADEDMVTTINDLWFSSHETQERERWVLIEDLPCDEDGETYDLTKAPTFTLPLFKENIAL